MATRNESKKLIRPERGFWANFWLILFFVQSLFYMYLVSDLLNRGTIERPVLVSLLIFVAIADVVALFGIWIWKKWGWYLLVVSTIASIVLGLIATATQLIVFHDVLPLVILGWVYRGRLDRFQ